MRCALGFWLVFCSDLLFGDELILKDGRNIPWKSITDEGDTLAVQTPDGRKLSIRKDEVDRIVTELSKDALPAPGLLTGASITFDRKKKLQLVDLLAKIDPKRDGITGTWAWSKTHGLVGTAGFLSSAKCQISNYVPPAEYDLTLVVTRKEGGDGLIVGLVSPLRQQFQISIDVFGSTLTAFPSGAGDHEDRMAGRIWPGRFFEKEKPRTLIFMVRKDACVIQADGKDFMTYKGDWTKVPNTPGTVQKNDSLYLSVQSSSFDISRMTVSAPSEKP